MAYPTTPAVNAEPITDERISDFSKRLVPVGRALELEGYFVWCAAPIEGPDGKTHVFFSRWKTSIGWGGWCNGCEIAHAVADRPEGPYTVLGTVLAPRGPGFWDATACHNPHIQCVDGKYCLFYMGNSNGKLDTKRVGLATADSLDGPWHRPDAPLLEVGPEDAWDDYCTTNPSFIKHPNGEYWLYYKSWNTADYHADKPPIRGNRKYGLAVSKSLTGPYVRHSDKPIIDFSGRGENAQYEDAFAWLEDSTFYLIARDMGYYNHDVGLIFESADGIHWGPPKVAFKALTDYVTEPSPPPNTLHRFGRVERPQLLMRNGKPEYLFTASQGGKHMTSSVFIFKIQSSR